MSHQFCFILKPSHWYKSHLNSSIAGSFKDSFQQIHGQTIACLRLMWCHGVMESPIFFGRLGKKNISPNLPSKSVGSFQKKHISGYGVCNHHAELKDIDGILKYDLWSPPRITNCLQRIPLISSDMAQYKTI